MLASSWTSVGGRVVPVTGWRNLPPAKEGIRGVAKGGNTQGAITDVFLAVFVLPLSL